MKFPFNTCPSWFTNFLVDEYLDEFHKKAKKYSDDRLKLLKSGEEFFNKKGFTGAKIAVKNYYFSRVDRSGKLDCQIPGIIFSNHFMYRGKSHLILVPLLLLE